MTDIVQCCKACSKKAKKDALMYGTGIVKQKLRKWYNPLRYILGKYYHQHIKLKEFYK